MRWQSTHFSFNLLSLLSIRRIVLKINITYLITNKSGLTATNTIFMRKETFHYLIHCRFGTGTLVLILFVSRVGFRESNRVGYIFSTSNWLFLVNLYLYANRNTKFNINTYTYVHSSMVFLFFKYETACFCIDVGFFLFSEVFDPHPTQFDISEHKFLYSLPQSYKFLSYNEESSTFQSSFCSSITSHFLFFLLFLFVILFPHIFHAKSLIPSQEPVLSSMFTL